METFKLKVKTTKTFFEEVEVTLPIYRKSICHFYKVYDQEDAICITDTTTNFSIAVGYTSHAFSEGNSDSTEQEFLDAYSRVSSKLENLAIKGIESITSKL